MKLTRTTVDFIYRNLKELLDCYSTNLILEDDASATFEFDLCRKLSNQDRKKIKLLIKGYNLAFYQYTIKSPYITLKFNLADIDYTK